MKAAVHTRYGPPDVVGIREVARPMPQDHEVLIRVHATTVNRTDCAYRAGTPVPARLVYGPLRPRATVLGCEFAGVVEAVGRDVTSFAVGHRVFGYNEGPFGAHAEYLTLPGGGSLAIVAERLSFEEAAPSVEGAHYALALIRAARVQRGSAVLVNGATGGIGSAAVQLLKNLGAHVTGVCHRDHLDLVAALGADTVIDHTAEDFTEGEQQYDVVFDAVGKSSFGRSSRVLRPHGVYLSSELGPLSQNPLLALVTPLLGGRQVRFPIPRHDQAMARHLTELSESGAFTPVVDRTYPLGQIVDAYRYVESGQKVGNVVITVA